MNSIGFILSVGALVLALFNQFELMPYADSIAHLTDEPYHELWKNAVAICKKMGIVVVVISVIAFILTTIYLIKSKNSKALLGTSIAIFATLIGILQINS